MGRETWEGTARAGREGFRGKSAIVGEWKIESQPYETTAYAVPKEVKAQYAEKKTAYRITIERI